MVVLNEYPIYPREIFSFLSVTAFKLFIMCSMSDVSVIVMERPVFPLKITILEISEGLIIIIFYLFD